MREPTTGFGGAWIIHRTQCTGAAGICPPNSANSGGQPRDGHWIACASRPRAAMTPARRRPPNSSPGSRTVHLDPVLAVVELLVAPATRAMSSAWLPRSTTRPPRSPGSGLALRDRRQAVGESRMWCVRAPLRRPSWICASLSESRLRWPRPGTGRAIARMGARDRQALALAPDTLTPRSPMMGVAIGEGGDEFVAVRELAAPHHVVARRAGRHSGCCTDRVVEEEVVLPHHGAGGGSREANPGQVAAVH